MVADSAPDKPVKVTIWRDGKEVEQTLTVVAYDPSRPQPQPPAPEQPKPPPTVDMLGLKVARLTPEWRKYFGLPDNARGIVITDVPQNGPGSAQGLRAGDLLVSAGENPVNTPDDVLQHIAAAKHAGRKNILIRVERDGNYRFITMPIAES
jgi:serine protease Do